MAVLRRWTGDEWQDVGVGLDAIPDSERGVPNGVATLGANGKLTPSQSGTITFVEAFGADPTGVADSTAAFTLAAVSAGSGGIVSLGENNTYLLSQWDPGRDLTIIGPGSTIRQAVGQMNAVRSTGGYELSFHGITFDQAGIGVNGLDRGVVHLDDCYPLLFEDCDFVNLIHGPSLRTTVSNRGVDVDHNPVFRRCTFTGNAAAYAANTLNPSGCLTAQAVNGGVIEDCTFTNVLGNAMWIMETENEPVHRWTLTRVRVRGTKRQDGGGGAVYYRGHDLTIDDCTLINCQANTLDIQGPASQTVIGENIRIRNSRMENDLGVIGADHSAMVLLRTCDTVINGCVIIPAAEDTTGNGVEAKWGGSLVLENNDLRKARLRTVRVSAGTTANAIDFTKFVARGNTIEGRNAGEGVVMLERADGTGKIGFAVLEDNLQTGHASAPFVRVVNNVDPLQETVERLHLGINDTNTTDVEVASGVVTRTTRASTRTSTAVRKTADETVNNSTVLQSDNDLQFSIAASEVWEATFNLFVIAGAASSDFSVGIRVPTGGTVSVGVLAARASDVVAESEATTGSDVAILTGISTVLSLVTVRCLVTNGATAGVVNLRWAQATAEAFDTTVKAGSYMVATRISPA